MRAATIITATILAVGIMGAQSAKAANNGELVQATGDTRVYYIEGNLKRHVKDAATFNAWRFNSGTIKRIGRAELNSHPTGPALTRVVNYAGNVFFVENGQRRWVPDFSTLTYNGVSIADMVFLNTDTFDRLSDGSQLTSPTAIRVPKDNRLFLIENGQRRPFADDATAAGWGVSRSSTPEVAALKSLPIGAKVTSLVSNGGGVYWVGNTKHYWIPTEAILLYNGLSWNDLSAVSDSSFARLSDGGRMRGPAMISTPGNSKIWMVEENGARRHIPTLELLYALGYNLSGVVQVSNAVAYRYPEGSDVTRYLRAPDRSGWYIIDGQRRKFDSDSAAMRRALGLADSDVRDFDWYGIQHINQGSDMTAGLETLEGYRIPNTSGKTAREQHLYLGSNEEALGRTDASAAVHYARSGTPSSSQNGMAGGYGAFGSSGSPASIEQERYYINMRWLYCEWYEDGGNTHTRNCSTTAKNWHRHKKVIVTNPSNGRQMILSVEESGPAIWTGRVSGLSPEAMDEIGAVTNSELTYLWAVNQDMRLGRIN